MEPTSSVEEAVARQIEPLIVMCEYFRWKSALAYLLAAHEQLLKQSGADASGSGKSAKKLSRRAADGKIKGLLILDRK